MADSAQEDLQARLTRAENKITDLERFSRDQAAQIVDLLAKNRTQTEIDSAMLARIDSFIESQNRSERRQIAGFDALMIGQKNLEVGQKSLETDVASLASSVITLEKNVAVLADVARDHKTTIEILSTGQQELQAAMTSQAQAIAALATGQEQIIQLLTGEKPPRND